MFATLIESRAAHVRRRGGAAASVVVHTAVILAAVTATGRTTQPVRPRPPEVVPLTLAPPAPPPVHTTMGDSRSTSSGPRVPPFTFDPRPLHGIDGIAGPTVNVDAVIDAAGKVDAGDFSGPMQGLGDGGYGGPVAGPYLPDQVEHVAVLRRIVRPAYPQSMERAGLSGRVVVRFVVDTAGHVELPSVDVRSATHPEFERAVRAVLPVLRFEAASAGGHRVRMLVEMPFEFALPGR